MTMPTANSMPPPMQPDDEHNRTLLARVHPSDWVNPHAAASYNLVVIGAGTAGLVTAAVAAALGARVALVERALMGGDCLNVGCVPSKGLLRAARAWAALHDVERFGVKMPPDARGDFGAAMARMRRLRAEISPNDSAQRFKELGVDVFFGEARFLDRRTIEVSGEVDGTRLRFARAALCTGARAALPPIPGLEEAGCHTNETIFTLTELPPRLAVIGAGPIGCELAQAFARFGSRVTVLEQADRLLPREEADAARLVQAQMERDGVQFLFRAAISKVDRRGDEKIVHYANGGRRQELAVDAILVGAGRRPNVEGLGLDRAGVTFTSAGVTVNTLLQTSNKRIYAAGDVCSAEKFTHAADAQAQILIQNALFPHPFGLGYAITSLLIIPRCTYTEPELAQVGLTEAEARRDRVEIQSYTVPLSEVDRARLDGEEDGLVRLHVRKGTEEIVGATIVASHAGELISQLSLAMKNGLKLGAITSTIYPYPTQAEAIKKAAQAWRKTLLTEGKKAILKSWFGWMR
jgi:pyruvate/2-oxoglutarate dehydrogenase complex dihydrolipoamide dehydrogenase (E3) component